MNNYDAGIEYAALKYGLGEDLHELESLLGDDPLKKYAALINSITDDVEQSVEIKEKKSPDSGIILSLAGDPIGDKYNNGSDKLQKASNQLNEQFESFYRINKIGKYLDKLIENVNPDKLPDIMGTLADEVIIILDLLRNSSSIQYSLEEDFVEKTYDKVYEMMLLELSLTGDDKIFKRIKDDETDTYFISKRIKKDLEKIDDEEIKLLQLRLEKQGLDRSIYMNKKLITLIAFNNYKEFKPITKGYFLRLIDEWSSNKKLLDAVDGYNKSFLCLENRRVENIKKNISNVKKQLSIIGLNALLIVPGFYLSSKLGQEHEYMTTTTTYDLSSGDVVSEKEYKLGVDESLTLKEYSPWAKASFLSDEYERSVTTYTLNDDAIHSFSKIDDVDAFVENISKEDIINSHTEEVKTKSVPDDLGYDDGKLVVLSEVKDLDNYNVVNGKDTYLFFGGFLFLDALLLFGLLSSRDSLFDSIKKIKKCDEESSENIKQLIDINRQKKDYSDCEAELRRKINSIYETLPSDMVQDKEISEGYQKVK